MSLAQSPTAIPVFPAVQQCVKFDSDCLTTGRHTFSCECDGAKQAWLQEKFSEVPLIFEDICELHTGRALNILTGEESDVPDVDLFVAGFVRKSVSTEKHTTAIIWSVHR